MIVSRSIPAPPPEVNLANYLILNYDPLRPSDSVVLVGWYLTFGHHDWMAIGEFPDEKAAATAILAAAAGGSLSDIETTVAMTAKDAHATFEAAGKAAKSFRSAGRS